MMVKLSLQKLIPWNGIINKFLPFFLAFLLRAKLSNRSYAFLLIQRHSTYLAMLLRIASASVNFRNNKTKMTTVYVGRKLLVR